MKTCTVCGKTDMEKEQINLTTGIESAIVWYRCTTHGDFCGTCISGSGIMAKPICKFCGKKLVSKRWF